MKNHPYILTTLIALVLAVVVWLCVPKEYTAVTKVSDEYKEVDLAIGMNMLDAKIKAASGGSNTGVNDIELYCSFLDSEDLFRSIANKYVMEKGCTYGEYLCQDDTIEAVGKHINYNYSGRQSTLIISFTDRDPIVAFQMLDSVTMELQNYVTGYRHQLTEYSLKSAKEEMISCGESYKKAQKEYDTFVDSHASLKTPTAKMQEKVLARELKSAYSQYEDATNKYVRNQALLQRNYFSFAVVQANTVPLKPNSYLISYILSFVAISLFLTFCIRRYKTLQVSDAFRIEWGDFFSPWCLTVVIWTGDILLYFLQGTLDPIGPEFVTCLTLWLITFLPCSLLTYWLSKDVNKTEPVDHKKPIGVNLYMFYGFVFLSLMMTLLYAKTIYNVVSQFETDNILYNIRILAIENTESYGLLNYTQGINIALFLIVIWLYPRVSKWVVALIVANNIILELAMMEKSGILVMILGTLFVLYERGKIRVRTIGVTFGLIIVFFFFFNMSKEDADSDKSMTFMDFFGMYVTSPMVAFEKLRLTISDTFAPNTLNDFYPQLQRFGIKIDVLGRLQEFVYVPIPTNVFSVMQPFYNDFGRGGVAFFGFLYGSLFGLVYRKFCEGNVMCKCFYTFLVEVIIIQFYNENFLQVFHLLMETTIVVVLLTGLERIRFYALPRNIVQYDALQKG